MARVREWIISGKARDAAAGRDDAWLQEMARADTLGSLPPLTAEQEKGLTLEELRVYVEARFWQAHYERSQTFAEAQREDARETIPSLENSIGRMMAALKA
jgi:hypothetical protein